MKAGIKEIGIYIPENSENNSELGEKFSVDENFLKDKIGVLKRSNRGKKSNVDMSLSAISNMSLDASSLELIVTVSQNPDYKIPHTSAIIHNELGAPEVCMTFDISQGCSGYVHGLNVVTSLMDANKLNNALLITVDPYSKIIDYDDKNTALLFGDAATATLISTDDPVYKCGTFTFGTVPESWKNLTCEEGGSLFMNGREIYNFALRNVVPDIKRCMEKNNVSSDDIDMYLFHQGSKFVVDSLMKKLRISPDRAAYDIWNYGNTVSSSIPLLLSSLLSSELKSILISGFGVGLTYSSVVLSNENISS